MTEAKFSKEKTGSSPAAAESRASEDTVIRFRNFVKDRATADSETTQSGAKVLKGLFDIERTVIGEIAPIKASVAYSYCKYEDGGPVGQEEDAELSIRVGEHEVFGLFISAALDREPMDVVDGEGESLGENPDAVVNAVLSAIERFETEGVITPAPVE